MLSGMEDYLRDVKKRKIKALGDQLTDEKLSDILSIRPRAEKIAIKDAKLRTFITCSLTSEGRLNQNMLVNSIKMVAEMPAQLRL